MVALAYAQGTDDSASNLQLVLVGLAIAAVAAAVAAVPIWAARRRRHPQLEIIGAAMVIWAVAVAWSGISLVAARADWAKEKTLRVESGYDNNPTDASSPQPPIAFWSALAAGWLLVNCWAFLMPIRASPASVAPRGTLQRSDSQPVEQVSSPPRDPLSS